MLSSNSEQTQWIWADFAIKADRCSSSVDVELSSPRLKPAHFDNISYKWSPIADMKVSSANLCADWKEKYITHCATTPQQPFG